MFVDNFPKITGPQHDKVRINPAIMSKIYATFIPKRYLVRNQLFRNNILWFRADHCSVRTAVYFPTLIFRSRSVRFPFPFFNLFHAFGLQWTYEPADFQWTICPNLLRSLFWSMSFITLTGTQFCFRCHHCMFPVPFAADSRMICSSFSRYSR